MMGYSDLDWVPSRKMRQAIAYPMAQLDRVVQASGDGTTGTQREENGERNGSDELEESQSHYDTQAATIALP